MLAYANERSEDSNQTDVSANVCPESPSELPNVLSLALCEQTDEKNPGKQRRVSNVGPGTSWRIKCAKKQDGIVASCCDMSIKRMYGTGYTAPASTRSVDRRHIHDLLTWRRCDRNSYSPILTKATSEQPASPCWQHRRSRRSK
jgi:hypothetical protein